MKKICLALLVNFTTINIVHTAKKEAVVKTTQSRTTKNLKGVKKRMRIYAILAHDNPNSLNAHIFNSLVKHLQNMGHTVDMLDLYKHEKEIPFYITDNSKRESNTFFQKNKKCFLEADKLLIVHPVYWYSTPGILKSWIDQITNYAYKYSGGPYAKALHKIDKLFVVNTGLAPVWFSRLFIGDLPYRQLRETFRWMGLKKSTCYRIGTIDKLNNKKVDRHMKKILAKADKWFR